MTVFSFVVHSGSCNISVISLSWFVVCKLLLNTSKAAGSLATVSGHLFMGKARWRLHWLWFSGACLSLRIQDVGQRKGFSHNWDWRLLERNLDCKNPFRLPTSIRVVGLMKGTRPFSALDRFWSWNHTALVSRTSPPVLAMQIRRSDLTNSGMRWNFFPTNLRQKR